MTASPVPSTDTCDAREDRRSHPRIAVALPAFLHAQGERHPVQLIDLSPQGAKLKGNATFPVGTPVRLSCGTLGRAAAVIWQQGEKMGLCFEIELDDRELAVQIQRSKGLAAWMKARE